MTLSNLYNKVLGTINKYQMIERGDKVVVALSGGPDSVALTCILKDLQPELEITLCAAHLNHSIRVVEADEDEKFTRKLATILDIPLVTKKVNVLQYKNKHKMSVEMAAREVRYHFLLETARDLDATRIATGHTANDQAEEVFLNLIRGAGPAGLSGIPPIRDGIFIRPLIRCFKSELIAYLNKIKIPFRIDSTNIDKKYLRNRIRHDIFPRLLKINPQLIGTLSKTAEILRDEETFWETYISKLARKILKSDQKTRTISIDLTSFQELHVAIQRRILRFAISTLAGRVWGIGYDRIEEILSMCNTDKNTGTIHLHGGIIVERRGKKLFVYTPHSGDVCFDAEIPQPGTYTITQPFEAKITIKIQDNAPRNFTELGSKEAIMDADKVKFPLRIRSFQPGDRFIPLGLGKTKKLQDFFVDEKVPRHMRPYVPILIDKEKIIWIIGHRIDDRVKVTPETKRTIYMRWDTENDVNGNP